MIASLRKPLFFISVALVITIVLVEIASTAVIHNNLSTRGAVVPDAPTPGYGIVYLALLDFLILFVVAVMGLGLVVPERILGRIQGIATLITSLIVLIVAIFKIIAALIALILMIGLFLAAPFGTLAYFAMYGGFPTDDARLTLGLLMTLKLWFAGSLLFAHQRFLQNKGLVLIILTSLLANLIVSLLHNFAPASFLVSITDAIAGLIVAILAAIWAVIFLIGSIPAIVKVLRIDRAI